MLHTRLGIVRGAIAVLINFAVILGLLILLGIIFHKTYSAPGSQGVMLTGPSALIWFLLTLAYLLIPKLRTGQTIGRKLVGGQPTR